MKNAFLQEKSSEAYRTAQTSTAAAIDMGKRAGKEAFL